MKVVAALMLFLAACSSATIRRKLLAEWEFPRGTGRLGRRLKVEPGGSITGRIFLGTGTMRVTWVSTARRPIAHGVFATRLLARSFSPVQRAVR
jgi:hypothetical protein